ncbi:leucine-rich repeat-containing protein 15-like isoform X2 [Condylostylus longicornis]|uniref:leucine-rich repeat-containing protein 15-like isoform X2 n=1 Tax=Condylostylus longicornis TaxID=2530218 RepID=UPI00244DEBC3|nr:leucine-rich repeat-containing protein 15-like isoform X2 [Condylostylus longicornis]
MNMKYYILIITIFFTSFIIESLSAEIWNADYDNINCPKQCFCQNAHFMDLSISRWINFMNSGNNQMNKLNYKEEDLVNNNEALYEGDDSYLTNPLIKQATCILQRNTDPKELFEQLPHDIQSLVILYSETKHNITILTSSLKPLNQLSTLEIRGPADQSLRLLIDEPLDFLVNANFDSIKLEGSELFKRPKNPIHPSESFNYVPNSEKMATYNLSLEIIENEYEILPYEIYVKEMKKSRMPSFYNWKSLEILRIYKCHLDELHWEMFDGLSELQHLSLEENDIKIIPAFALYGALHIKTLSLAHNNIFDLHYRSLAGLLDLEILNLSFNNLTKLSELTFPPFPKLEIIDFRHNPIHYIFPATFGVMNTTQVIYLGSNDMMLELNNNKPFESLNMLKYLNINNISIASLNQNIFKNLKQIKTLTVHGYIGKIDFDAFVDLEELKDLNLSYCGIKEISMDAFIGSVNLEIIDLSNNQLTYIQPGTFDDQINIIEIYLQNNKLKFLPSNFFMSSTLKLLRLTGNPWKCSCDMIFWEKRITNQFRNMRIEKCIKDFKTEKIISCKKINSYSFDNRLSPRCQNLKNRGLYYVLRRDLQCGIKQDGKKGLKHLKNNEQDNNLKKNHKEKVKKNRENNEFEKDASSKKMRRNKWKKNSEKRSNSGNKGHVNSLKYLSTHNNNENEFANIFGKIDDLNSFNNI